MLKTVAWSLLPTVSRFPASKPKEEKNLTPALFALSSRLFRCSLHGCRIDLLELQPSEWLQFVPVWGTLQCACELIRKEEIVRMHEEIDATRADLLPPLYPPLLLTRLATTNLLVRRHPPARYLLRSLTDISSSLLVVCFS